jgi:hypothetical protein
MVNFRIIALSILAIMTASSCERTIRILDVVPENCITAMNETKVVKEGDELVLVSTGANTMGVSIKQKFDFGECNRFRVTVRNEDSLSYFVYIFLYEEERPGHSRAAVKGRISKMYTVKAGQTSTLEMPIPAELPHPDVDEKFKLMRNTPYSRLTGLYSYNADVSNIKEIRIRFNRCNVGSKVTLSDIEAVYGEREIQDKMLEASSDEFFPFIDKYGQFKHAQWTGKISCDEDLLKAREVEEMDLAKNPGPSDRSRFGGWAAGPRLEATGRFRVEKYQGKWWMVDPEGYLFWSHGVVRVTPSTAITPLDDRHFYFEELPQKGSEFEQFYYTHDALLKPYYASRNLYETYDFSSSNCYRKYGPDYKDVFANLSHRRLLSWGLNTIANSSDKDICLLGRTPYIDRLEVRSKPIEGSGGQWLPFMDPFDPSFVESVKSQLLSRQREIKDPWLLGLFVDNEIHWGDVCYLARCAIKASEDQAAKKEFVNVLKRKYENIESLNSAWGSDFASWEALIRNRDDVPVGADADLRIFNEMIIHKYYGNIRNLFDQYAPGVLYMGCRFASEKTGANASVIAIGQQYCDVISYNIYCHELTYFPFPDGFDKPVIVGEFHFGALDRGLFHAGLVDVGSQQERGVAYENYLLSALKHPNFIGTHWHQFSDQATTGRFDGENLQVGFTDCCDTPYYETIAHVRKVGYDMYKIRSRE